MNMPCPLMARSRFESVNSMLPCANCWVTAATRTPLPLALLDTPCSETANKSANSVRDPLKPLVEVLAMLLAVTFKSDCAALSPESAMRNGMIYSVRIIASEHSFDVAHGEVTECVGGQHESTVLGIECHAGYERGHAGLERDVFIAHLGDDFDL